MPKFFLCIWLGAMFVLLFSCGEMKQRDLTPSSVCVGHFLVEGASGCKLRVTFHSGDVDTTWVPDSWEVLKTSLGFAAEGRLPRPFATTPTYKKSAFLDRGMLTIPVYEKAPRFTLSTVWGRVDLWPTGNEDSAQAMFQIPYTQTDLSYKVFRGNGETAVSGYGPVTHDLNYGDHLVIEGINISFVPPGIP